MMSNELTKRIATRYGLEAPQLLETLKHTVIKGKATNEQMIAFLLVADQHQLNPFTQEIYAFPKDGGIIPMIGVDGWIRMMNEHPQFDGLEFRDSEESIKVPGSAVDCPTWIESTVYRKDRNHPIKIKERLADVYRPTSPWKTNPYRMLRHKALIQCGRIAFGFSGIYEPDEAERILEAKEVPSLVIETITPEEETTLKTLIVASQSEEAKVLAYAGVAAFHDIHRSQYPKLAEALETKIRNQATGGNDSCSTL